MDEKKSIMYAHKGKIIRASTGEKGYTDIENHPYTTYLYDQKEEIIAKVLVEENISGEVSPYWGFWDNKRQEFQCVFPSDVQMRVCFPYGVEAEEKLGRGKAVNVVIEELEVLENIRDWARFDRKK